MADQAVIRSFRTGERDANQLQCFRKATGSNRFRSIKRRPMAGAEEAYRRGRVSPRRRCVHGKRFAARLEKPEGRRKEGGGEEEGRGRRNEKKKRGRPRGWSEIREKNRSRLPVPFHERTYIFGGRRPSPGSQVQRTY